MGTLCSKVPIVDELGDVWMQSQLGYLGEEGVALYVAMRAEPGGDAVKIAVVIAGMATEFEGPFCGYRAQDFVEGFAVEIACGRNADSSISSEDVVSAYLRLAFEARLEVAEKFDLKAANAIAVA